MSPRSFGEVDDLRQSVIGYIAGLSEFLVSAAGADDVRSEVPGELRLGDLAVGVELDRQETVVQRKGFGAALPSSEAE